MLGRFLSLLASLLLLIICSVGSYMVMSGTKLLSLQSNSMKPAIQMGDAVVVERVKLSNLQVGDVISYRSPRNQRMIITHRLIGVQQQTGQLITHGDALELQDPPFQYNMVIGRAVGFVPRLGFLLDWVREPVGLFVLIYVPAILIFSGEVRRLAKYYRRPYYQNYWYRLGYR